MEYNVLEVRNPKIKTYFNEIIYLVVQQLASYAVLKYLLSLKCKL